MSESPLNEREMRLLTEVLTGADQLEAAIRTELGLDSEADEPPPPDDELH